MVDDERRRPFFGLPVHPLDALTPDQIGDVPYGGIVVMSLHDMDARRARLETRGCPAHRIHTL